MDSLLELFCSVDDFCQEFEPAWKKRLLTSGEYQRQRERSLTLSEIMTIVIHFHQSQYRNFKAYYTEHTLKHLRSEFPNLVSYSRFVEFMPSALIPLSVYCGRFVLEPVQASLSSTRQPLMSAITVGLHNIGSLKDWPNAEKRRPAGFSVSNCTWWSMIVARY